jgi:hypothetical protein
MFTPPLGWALWVAAANAFSAASATRIQLSFESSRGRVI